VNLSTSPDAPPSQSFCRLRLHEEAAGDQADSVLPAGTVAGCQGAAAEKARVRDADRHGHGCTRRATQEYRGSAGNAEVRYMVQIGAFKTAKRDCRSDGREETLPAPGPERLFPGLSLYQIRIAFSIRARVPARSGKRCGRSTRDYAIPGCAAHEVVHEKNDHVLAALLLAGCSGARKDERGEGAEPPGSEDL